MMNVRHGPVLFFILLMRFFPAAAEEAEIRLSASVDRTEVPLNRTVELTIRLQWSGDLDRFDIHQFENPILQNLEITGNASSNRVSSEMDRKTSVTDYLFTLKPKSLGMAYIEGVIITYTDLQADRDFRLTTNRIGVKVVDPVPEPGEGAGMLARILSGMALVAVAVFVILFLRRRREKQAEIETIETTPVEETYLQEMAKIDLDDPELDVAAGFSDLSRLLRRFLSQKLDLPGLEATTREVTAALENRGLPDRFVQEVAGILETADLHKFSGRGAERSELDRTFSRIEAILQKSLRGEITPERTDSD